MEPINDGWSIIIVGAWNRRIFTPQWLKKNKLTEQELIGIAVPLNNPTLPIRLDFDNVYLHISDERLVLNPKDCQIDDHIKDIQKAAKIIVEKLEHTPLVAVGINFQFQEDKCPDKLGKAFAINDSFSDEAGDLTHNEIKRSYKHKMGVLNFTISGPLDLSKITLDYNYHREVEKSEEAVSFLNEDIIKLKEEAIDLYKKAYEDDK